MDQKGLAPVIILLVIAATLVGGITIVKLPEIKKQARLEEEHKNLIQATLPEGSAAGDEILVGFKSNTPKAQIENIHRKTNAKVKKNIQQVDVDVVKLSVDTPVPDAIAKYKNIEEVEFAEPNFLATAFLTPNDPLYSSQWNLKKIASEEAYDISKEGFGPIAIVDTGVESSHPDLAGLIINGYNTIDENTNSNDDHGHGTHVAGIASAQTDNSTGVASISYRTKVLPIKVLNKDGIGTYEDVAEGIIYAADKGSGIINLSLGGSSDSETLKRAVKYAQSKGGLIVAAAGNNGNNTPVYPASYPGVLAVTASDPNDNIASFSSYGSNTFVAAPGVSINSLVPGGSYRQYSGTSMAAPHLSGLIALVLSSNPTLSSSDAMNQIKNNAEKIGPYSYDSNGWNPYYGYGRISAGKTLTSTASPSSSATQSANLSPGLKQKQSSQAAETRKQNTIHLKFFEIQGKIEGVEVEKGKFVIKVSGGTPNVLDLIRGNIVEIFINQDTKIKNKDNGLQLSELTRDTKVHTSGKLENNRLIAKEITVQGKVELSSGQQTSAIEESSQNNSQTENALSKEKGNNGDNNSSGGNFQGNSSNNPASEKIPDQAKQKGKGVQ